MVVLLGVVSMTPKLLHSLVVRNGKCFCTVHKQVHKLGNWEEHRGDGHTIITIPFRHILYTGSVCKEHDTILVDEET